MTLETLHRQGLLLGALVCATMGCDDSPSTSTTHDASDSKPIQIPEDASSKDAARDGAAVSDAGFDCASSQDSYCVSVNVVMNGDTLSLLCLPSNKDLIGRSTTQFRFNCSAASPAQVTLAGVGPEKGPGQYDVGFAAAQADDPNLELLDVTDDARNLILSTRAANTSEATLTWTESDSGAYAGSFSGKWDTPAGSCKYFGYSCAAGTVQGTFKFTWP
jgi:hypothetical protein